MSSDREQSRPIGNRQILGRVARGMLQGLRKRRTEMRFQLLRDLWTILKRFGVGDVVRNVDIRELPALRDLMVETYVDDRDRAVLAALCQALDARTFFEIGTNRGRTALSVARTVPELSVYTLDLPDPDAAAETALDMIDADQRVFGAWQRGIAYRDQPEEERIESLLGDSASFDYSQYEGRIDVVFIDGSHSYPYVRSDTVAALKMLSPGGAIVWDDYPGFPGVLQAVLEAADELDGEILHVLDTRLAIWTRTPLDIEPLPEDEYRSVSVA